MAEEKNLEKIVSDLKKKIREIEKNQMLLEKEISKEKGAIETKKILEEIKVPSLELLK